MTDQVQSNRRAAEPRSILRGAIFAVALVIPLSFIFAAAWSTPSAAVDAVKTEQHGVAYLRSLAVLTTTLTQTASISIGGNAVNFDPLNKAALDVGKADTAYGDNLHTSALWNNLSTKIQQLQGRQMSVPLGVIDAYSEISTLLLQLYDKVRTESGLVRDPDPDTYFLTDGAAHQLPAAVIAAGQYGDIIVGSTYLAAPLLVSLPPLSLSTRATLFLSSQELIADITAAVDAGGSGSLNPTVLARLDKFRLSIDALAPITTLVPAYQNDNAVAEAAKDKAATEDAATELSSSMLDTVDELLLARLSNGRGGEAVALVAGLVALLVALGPLFLAVRDYRRANRAFGRGIAPASSATPDAPAVSVTPVADVPIQRPGSTLPTRVPERRQAVTAGIGPAPSRHRATPDVPSAEHDYWER